LNQSGYGYYLGLTFIPTSLQVSNMPSVLVVDDSMLIRHAVCRFFEDRGFHVESAANGAEAVEMLLHFRPDIIITDLQMPKMDGPQLIDHLKGTPITSGIPIVVLAGRKNGSESITGIRADYLIYKDIDIAGQLQHVLETALPGSGSSQD